MCKLVRLQRTDYIRRPPPKAKGARRRPCCRISKPCRFLQRLRVPHRVAQHQASTTGFLNGAAQFVGASARFSANAHLIEDLRPSAAKLALDDDQIPTFEYGPVGLLDGCVGGEHAVAPKPGAQHDTPRPFPFVHASFKLAYE